MSRPILLRFNAINNLISRVFINIKPSLGKMSPIHSLTHSIQLRTRIENPLMLSKSSCLKKMSYSIDFTNSNLESDETKRTRMCTLKLADWTHHFVFRMCVYVCWYNFIVVYCFFSRHLFVGYQKVLKFWKTVFALVSSTRLKLIRTVRLKNRSSCYLCLR